MTKLATKPETKSEPDSGENVKKIEADTRDEIDKILSEVEQLRKELSGENDAPATRPAPTVKTAPSVATPPPPAIKASKSPPEAVSPAEEEQAGDELAAEVSAKDEEVDEMDAEDPHPDDEESLIREFRISANAQDVGLEEALAELSAVEPDTALKANSEVRKLKAVPCKPSKSSSDLAESNEAQTGTLSLTLSGNMTLKLKYEYEGQEIVVGFAEQFLKIELADGTEFKVPVGSRALSQRKAV